MKNERRYNLRPALAVILLSAATVLSARAAEVEFTSIRRASNGITVAWTNPTPGYAYTLQVTDRLWPIYWRNAPTRYRWPTVTDRWTEWGAPTGPGRFYRVLAEPVGLPDRGKLIGATLRQTLSVAAVQSTLSANGLGAATWPVRFYKLLYETVDPFGLPILASGALYVPQGPTNALPLLSYQHGTLLPEILAPSTGNTFENAFGALFATAGYVALLPDYVGLGDSPGLHPYCHTKTEATAVIDMLRAVRTFCSTNGVTLNPQVFLAGYSQGGQATMATHREIEASCTNEFTIAASAPMSAAYDFSGVNLSYLLTNRNFSHPCIVPYVIAAYVPIYRLADTLEELLFPPYDRTLAPLLDGSHGWEMDTVMPKDLFAILRPDYLEDFRNNPENPLRAALRDNDLYQWMPRAPMHLYHCSGDTSVPFANSVVAYQSFTNNGACCVLLIDPGLPARLDHEAGYIPSLLAAKAWFDTLKQ